jgi:hypothetical protein
VVNREQKRNFSFDQAITIKTNTDNEVKIYKNLTEDGTEAILYCYSENRDLKESSIWLKKCDKFEAEVKHINDGLTKPRCQRDLVKIQRRLGRLLQKYSGVSQHYTITVFDNSCTKSSHEPLNATNIILVKKPLPGSMMDQPGVYCLRSNILTMSAEQMWRQYSKITDIESVFRSLKSELGLRPIYHYKDNTIEGHIFLTILAYQCVQMIRSVLKASGINDSWWAIRNSLASHGRVTFVLSTDKGGYEHIRLAIEPESWQVSIYRTLRISYRPGDKTLKHCRSCMN